MTRMKDSGIEWIGEIPEDWEVKNLRHVLKERNILNNPIRTYLILSLTKDRGVIPYSEKGDIGNKAKEDLTKYKVAMPDDIVLNSMNVIIGSVGLSKYMGCVSPVYYMLYPINKFSYIQYYDYIFRTKELQKLLKGYGNGIMEHRLRIPMINLKKVPLPFPPKDQQEKIANFLDEKVGEIDMLIEKTKEVIKDYKSYKQSLITETVTKGLRKDVALKDSGIEWVGKIPEHWEVVRPTRICEIIRGNSSFQKTDLKSKGDYIALQYGRTYKVDIIDESYKYYVDKSFYKSDQIVENGDTILISTSETMQDLGHSCFYNIDDIALLGGEQMCFKANKEYVLDKFLYYSTKYFNIELNQYATGLKVYRFRLDDLKKINMVLPPKNEQYKIINFLNEKLPLIDQIISTKEKLLKELEAYKKSLIYETVTGKREVD